MSTSSQSNPPSPRGPGDVDAALRAIRAALVAHEVPVTFADVAWDELLDRESEFVSELGLEAIRRARQGREEVVSRKNVADADLAIRGAGQTGLITGAQTVGGLLFGGGITGIAAWATAQHRSTLVLVISIIGALLGAAMIAFTIGVSWKR